MTPEEQYLLAKHRYEDACANDPMQAGLMYRRMREAELALDVRAHEGWLIGVTA